MSATQFLRSIFEHAEGGVWLTSLSDNGGTPLHWCSDAGDSITRALAWDQAGRGLYFCVSTIKAGGKRQKADVQQLVMLHIDIDLKDVEWNLPINPEAQKRYVWSKLIDLECPPSFVVDSGNGVHAYWLFDEPVDPDFYRAEEAMRMLCTYLCGDFACCDISRLMRLPDSHNTKNGAWHEVTLLLNEPTRRYDPIELGEWISALPWTPLIARKEAAPRSISERAKASRMPADNVFLEAARSIGYRPRLDVITLLDDMRPGNIHETQLLASASLMATGVDFDVAVEMIARATERVGEPGWNWDKELKTIEALCHSAMTKFGKKRA